jgi:hypothetical protein
MWLLLGFVLDAPLTKTLYFLLFQKTFWSTKKPLVPLSIAKPESGKESPWPTMVA